MSSSAPERRAGAFEAPASPPAVPSLQVDPQWSARQLSGALIRGVWPWVLSGSVLLILYSAASTLLPVMVGHLVDAVFTPTSAGIQPEELTGPLLLWAGLLAGLYLVINLTYRFGGRLGWFGVQRSQFELSQAVLRRVLDTRGMAGSPRPPGQLLAVSTADVHRACLVLYVTVYPPGQVVGLCVAAAVLFTVHPVLGLGVVVTLPMLLVLMHRVARPLRRRSAIEQAGLADAAAAAADLVAGYRVLRGIHAHGVAAGRYRGISRRALGTTLAARSARAAFEGVSAASAQLFAALLVATAAVLAFTGQITAGELVTVGGIAVVLIGPLNALTGTLGSFWAVSQASATRVLDLLSTSPHPAGLGEESVEQAAGSGQADIAEAAGAVEGAAPNGFTDSTEVQEADELLVFKNLGLPDGTRLHASVGSGEFLVLSLSQSAQVFLAELLSARRIPEFQGTVLLTSKAAQGMAVQERAVQEYEPKSLRGRLLVLPHSPGIFGGTVLENVRAAWDEPVSEESAQQALHVAALSSAELPEAHRTWLSDAGPELSGGQRQRVALARAVAAAPEVLVLVEPTTSVDAVTEQRITSRLREHREGQTTIILTSSPAFRAVADRTLFADQQVAENV